MNQSELRFFLLQEEHLVRACQEGDFDKLKDSLDHIRHDHDAAQLLSKDDHVEHHSSSKNAAAAAERLVGIAARHGHLACVQLLVEQLPGVIHKKNEKKKHLDAGIAGAPAASSQQSLFASNTNPLISSSSPSPDAKNNNDHDDRNEQVSGGPLHQACAAGHVHVVDYLLQAGVAEMLHECTADGWTPLHFACAHGHVHVVARLQQEIQLQQQQARVVRDNPKPHVKQQQQQQQSSPSPLLLVWDHHGPLARREIVELLLRRRHDDDDGDDDASFSQHYVDELLHARDAQGCTILHLASQRHDVEVLKLLLLAAAAANNKMYHHGDDDSCLLSDWINVRDCRGSTALNMACGGRCDRTVQVLLQYHADPTIPRIDGVTPLHRACKGAKLQQVQFLLSRHQQIQTMLNAREHKEGRTPLMECCHEYWRTCDVHGEMKEIVTLLLLSLQGDKNHHRNSSHVAVVDVADKYGRTVLMQACRIGITWMVDLLLEAGHANVHCRDVYGKTALHEACHQGHLEIVQLLLKKGACFRQRDCLGHCSLVHAMHGGCLETLFYLLREHNGLVQLLP